MLPNKRSRSACFAAAVQFSWTDHELERWWAVRSDYRHVSRGSYCKCTLCAPTEATIQTQTWQNHTAELFNLDCTPAEAVGISDKSLRLGHRAASAVHICIAALAYCSVIADPSTSLDLRLPRVTDVVKKSQSITTPLPSWRGIVQPLRAGQSASSVFCKRPGLTGMIIAC